MFLKPAEKKKDNHGTDVIRKDTYALYVQFILCRCSSDLAQKKLEQKPTDAVLLDIVKDYSKQYLEALESLVEF